MQNCSVGRLHDELGWFDALLSLNRPCTKHHGETVSLPGLLFFCQVKIKYRTSTNLILQKGTLFYNEDMQTVEVETSGSDESSLGSDSAALRGQMVNFIQHT